MQSLYWSKFDSNVLKVNKEISEVVHASKNTGDFLKKIEVYLNNFK